MKSASSILREVLKGLGMGGALSLGRIAGKWDALFRGALSLHTSPESIKGSTLTVNVDSPSWLHQAGFFKSEMLKKLEPFGIRDVRFRLGKVHKTGHEAESSAASHPPAPPSAEDIRSVDLLVAGIKDEELKETIRRAALASTSAKGRKSGQRE